MFPRNEKRKLGNASDSNKRPDKARRLNFGENPIVPVEQESLNAVSRRNLKPLKLLFLDDDEKTDDNAHDEPKPANTEIVAFIPNEEQKPERPSLFVLPLPKMDENPVFNTCYEEKMKDEYEIEYEIFYPDFFVDSRPVFEKIRNAITESKSDLQTDTERRQAIDVFRNLYKSQVSFRCIKNPTVNNNPFLKALSDNWGNKILAHGVEEMKGGMFNLVLMAISDCVRVAAPFWGYFKPGLPNLSPLAHGPYFVIYSCSFNKESRMPNHPSLDQVEYILVPFQENIRILQAFSEKVVEDGLLDKKQQELFLSKLITYHQLQLTLTPEMLEQSTLKTNSLF